MSVLDVVDRVDMLVIDLHNVQMTEHSTCVLVYDSLAAALADRLRIYTEAVIVEDKQDEQDARAVVLVFAPAWAIRSAGLADRAHPVTEIRFRHHADACAFMGE